MLMLIRLVELLFVLLGVLFIVTQIILPVFTREKLFPAFRQKSERLRREEADRAVTEKLDDLERRVELQETVRDRISELENRLNGAASNSNSGGTTPTPAANPNPNADGADEL